MKYDLSADEIFNLVIGQGALQKAFQSVNWDLSKLPSEIKNLPGSVCVELNEGAFEVYLDWEKNDVEGVLTWTMSILRSTIVRSSTFLNFKTLAQRHWEEEKSNYLDIS